MTLDTINEAFEALQRERAANALVCVRCGTAEAFHMWALIVDANGELRAVGINDPRGGCATAEAPVCSACTCATIRYRDGREDPPPVGPLFDDTSPIVYAIGGIMARIMAAPAERLDVWGRELPPSP